MNKRIWKISGVACLLIASGSIFSGELDLQRLQDELQKYKEVNKFTEAGQSIKAERLKKEADTYLNNLFREKKRIQANTDCPFTKAIPEEGTSQRIITLSCARDLNIRILFQVHSAKDQLATKRTATSDSIIESLEEMRPGETFLGELEFAPIVRGYGYRLYIDIGGPTDSIAIDAKITKFRRE